MSVPFRPGAILFDMDGLLVDSEPLWWQLERELARNLGGAWTDEHALRCVGKGLAATLGMMKDDLGLPVDMERDHAWLIDSFIARVDALNLKPGAVELLEASRGVVPTALASSSPEHLIAAVLARFGLESSFDVRVSGEKMPNPKPAPDIFFHAARALGHAPERCVVLEDSLAGATAGRAAGTFVIAVPEQWPAPPSFAKIADYVARNLFDARTALDLTDEPLR